MHLCLSITPPSPLPPISRDDLAEHDPQPGTSVAEKVDAALQRATLLVVLVTSTSENSNYVQQEIGAGRAYRKPVIPIIDSRIVGKVDLGMLAGIEPNTRSTRTLTRTASFMTPCAFAIATRSLPASRTPSAWSIANRATGHACTRASAASIRRSLRRSIRSWRVCCQAPNHAPRNPLGTAAKIATAHVGTPRS